MSFLIKCIERFLQGGTIAVLVALCIVLGIQIFGRYMMKAAPFWTEETSRFLFLYLIAFGSGLAVKEKAYVNLDVISNLLSVRARKFLELIVDFITIGFMVMLLNESITIMDSVKFQKSPVLGISMSIPYASLLLISVSVTLFLCLDVWQVARSIVKGGDRQ